MSSSSTDRSAIRPDGEADQDDDDLSIYRQLTQTLPDDPSGQASSGRGRAPGALNRKDDTSKLRLPSKMLVKCLPKHLRGAATVDHGRGGKRLPLRRGELHVDRGTERTSATRGSGHNDCIEFSNQISLWQMPPVSTPRTVQAPDVFRFGTQILYRADCFDWLDAAEPNTISAVVTDPPYGLIEYDAENQRKMRSGRGGIWRIPPSFDGAQRRPLPRFTVLRPQDRNRVLTFFERWGRALLPVLRPGAHVVVAGNPLVSPLVAVALERVGFERRGEIVRLVRTFRGGDRPKGAEAEFADISSMPRACWEPWGLYRKPLAERTLAENLRAWGTGGLRRVSAETPFLDVIESRITPDDERRIAPHPSVKPQEFLRRIVRAVMPRSDGVLLDTFAGCATTLAACQALGLSGIGIELDDTYYSLATQAIPKLAKITTQPT